MKISKKEVMNLNENDIIITDELTKRRLIGVNRTLKKEENKGTLKLLGRMKNTE